MLSQRIPQDVYTGDLTIAYRMKCDGDSCLCAVRHEFVMRKDGEKYENCAED